jgi:hypothetical protein
LRSIALGISGAKGDVHVSFGTPLRGEFDNADAVAAAVDAQIIDHYVLHPTNFFAYKKLHGSFPKLPCGAKGEVFDSGDYATIEAAFETRIAAMPEQHRPYALAIYANPVVSKLGRE